MKSRFLNVTPEVSQNPRSRCKETDGEHFSHSRASLPQRGGRVGGRKGDDAKIEFVALQRLRMQFGSVAQSEVEFHC